MLRVILIFIKWVGAPRRAMVAAAVATALMVTACGPATDPEPTAGGDDVVVVATTGILGDVAKRIVGDRGRVRTLIPPGIDPHDYQPSAADVGRLVDADLVVANGLGLEEGLAQILDAAAADGANVLTVGDMVEPRIERGGVPDPHFWLDPALLGIGAVEIGNALSAVDDSADWAGRGADVSTELTRLGDEIERLLSDLAAERRLLVTNHDSLAYFARRFDFEVLGTIIPGGSTVASPSPADLADLVAAIEGRDVQAIFAETTEPDDLAAALAEEVGHDVAVVELYTGSLGEPGSTADTYAGMMRVNAERIAEALG